jgi:hypothetical protein
VKLTVRFFSQIFVIVLTGVLAVIRNANVNLMRCSAFERVVPQKLMAARAR